MPKKKPVKEKKIKKVKKNYAPAVITIFITLIVLLIIGYKHNVFESQNFQTIEAEQDGSFKVFNHNVKDVMLNSEIKVPGTNQIVTLKNGKADFSEDEAQGTIQMENVFRVVKIGNNDFNVFGIVTVNYGGSGDFNYIVLYHATEQLFEYSDFSNIGDRIIVNSIDQLSKVVNEKFVVGINYLDRGPNAPMSDKPTINKTLKLDVIKSKFTSD